MTAKPKAKQFPIKDGQTTFGLHFMIDAYKANPSDLNDLSKIYHFLNDLPDRIGMHKLAPPTIVNASATATGKDPGGITGFVLIAESHISIHTFANKGFFTMDIYSCNDFTDHIDTILKHIQQTFPHQEHEINQVRRGTKYPM